MEQHNQNSYCQCQKQEQLQQHLQYLQKQHLQQFQQHCQHFCPSAFGHAGPFENLPAGVMFKQCCECQFPIPPVAVQTEQMQDENEETQNKNAKHEITKITMHKINVDKVTIGKPRGKGCCDDVKLMRNPKPCRQKCPIHQQPSSDVPDDKVNDPAPAGETLQLFDASKGVPKEIPLKLGLLQLPKSDKNQDPNQKSQNVGQIIAPVCSTLEANEDDPPRTAIVIVKPRSEKKDTGSLDMLVVCQGKDPKTICDEQGTEEEPMVPEIAVQQTSPQVAPNKPLKKCRKKRKAPPLPPQAFGPPPPLLCTRSVCSIS